MNIGHYILQKLNILVIFIITGFCVAQERDFDEIVKYIAQSQLDSAQIILERLEPEISEPYETGLLHFYRGLLLKHRDIHNTAFKEFLLSEKEFLSVDSLRNVADVNYEIYDLFRHQKDLKTDPLPYLDKFIEYAKKTEEPLYLARAFVMIGDIYNHDNNLQSSLLNYNSAIDELEKIDDTIRIALVKMNIATAYNTISKQADSALYYLKDILPILKKVNSKQFLFVNYNNQGEAYKEKGDYSKALKYYLEAEAISLNEYDKKTRKILYENLSDLFYKNEDYENAFLYADKLIKVKDSIGDTEQNIGIAEIQEQFDNEKLRADNLESEAKRTQNRNAAYGLAGGLLTVSIIGFLLFKNTKRKQYIAEQEKELEIQKKEKILKEQELSTIDAMIEGQEKERQRLASDLHDSVGATITSARLQFEHLEKNRGNLPNENELFDKVGSLIENVQKEIRAMAHLKNSGVIAKKGLLPALEKLAKNASGTNNLQVEVQDFGLEDRLENTLEITIFRIIQELVTNVIKHANASEAQISITQHSDSLSIIVEDNGSGFNTQQFQNKEGMGLSNIERRVEHLEGTMEADSMPGKGTSVLIDIPL